MRNQDNVYNPHLSAYTTFSVAMYKASKQSVQRDSVSKTKQKEKACTWFLRLLFLTLIEGSVCKRCLSGTRSLQMQPVAPVDSKALSPPSSESVLSGVSLAKGLPYNPSH